MERPHPLWYNACRAAGFHLGEARLERKRDLCIEVTGVTSQRVLLAAATTRSRRAQALREAGFEVIEPEGETEE